MDLTEIKTLISPEMERVENTIAEVLSAETESLTKLIEHVTLFSGKRLRPALIVLIAKALGKTTEDHIKLGAVVELIHTASLIHDDILDAATMRRRVASVNHLHGNHVPVLLGDLIYARAFGLSLEISSIEAARELAAVTQTICSGEIEQIFQRGCFDLEETLYYTVIEAKTASLYGAACGLAARYSGLGKDQADRLAQYGLALGTAFQVVDDCLDINGDEDVVGKSLGTDLQGRKMTLPMIHLAATLEGKQRDRLKEIFLSDSIDNKKAAIEAEFDLQGSVQHAFKKADGFISRALEMITILPAGPCRDALETVADFVLHRKL